MDALQVDTALSLMAGAADLRQAAQTIRSSLAPCRVLVMDAMDMRDETPFVCNDRWALYLGASDGHCWQVTLDLDQARGFFLSELDQPARQVWARG